MPPVTLLDKPIWVALFNNFINPAAAHLLPLCWLKMFVMSFGEVDDHASPHIGAEEIGRACARWNVTPAQVMTYADALAKAGWLTRHQLGQYDLAVPPRERRRYADALDLTGYILGVERTPLRTDVPAARNTSRRCALYRWRDADGTLLYVGVTHDMKQRIAGHASKSRWWVFAANHEVEWFPTRYEAELAEAAAIRQEKPIFNTAHNRTAESAQRIVDYLTLRKRLDLLPEKLAA